MIPLRPTHIKYLAIGVLCGSQLVCAETLPEATCVFSTGTLKTGSRTLASYTDYVTNPDNMELSKWGGWKAQRVKATGYFRTEKIGDRWWAVDPEGYLYISKTCNSVYPNSLTPDEIYDILLDTGANGLGGWSDESILESSRQDDTPLAYCPKRSFLGEFEGRDRGINMPVFDEDWPAHCDAYAAQELTQYVGDPAVFGFMSDNEISFYSNLEEHLAINDNSDNNYTTAINFLSARGKTASNWESEDEDAYVALIADTYYGAVSAAIKKVDPNHMYLGSRNNSAERYNQAFMEAAGKYVDIFSMNHYSRWGARQVAINNMSDWLGKPLMITEFYAMQTADGVGAGWKVDDQESRGLFYQNYVSTLLDTKDLVGFHWFKFQDDKNGNKGLIDQDENVWAELQSYMKEMNESIYDFVNYLDSRDDFDAVLTPEADAFYSYDENHGLDDILVMNYNGEDYQRETYIRFDVSSLSGPVQKATIKLKSVIGSAVPGQYVAQFVPNNTWGETTLTMANHPKATTQLYTWTYGDDVEIDVTAQVNAALSGDEKISIRTYATMATSKIPYYGSREHENPNAHPELRIDYVPISNPLDYVVSSSTSSSAPSVSNNDLAQTEYLSSFATGGNEVSSQHAQLFNGNIGDADGNTSDSGEVTMSSDNTVTVTFDTSVNTYGYDISGINTYFGWNPANGGRANQGYKIILTLIDGTTATLASPQHWEPNTSVKYWTTVSFEPGTGSVMAKNVKSITFDIVNDANAGGVVVGREFDIFGSPTTIPAAHWRLNTGTGNIAIDSSGNGYDGSITDGAWVSGINGNSLNFNGSSSKVTLPVSVFNTVDDEVSLAMWIYGASTQARRDSLFYAVNTAGTRILNAHLPWDNSTVYWDAGSAGSAYDRISKKATSSQFKGEWNHWVFTKNAATGIMKIYHNGSLWQSGSSKTKSMSGITAATLGAQQSGFNYAGAIDDVSVYDIELTADEIEDLFFSYLP